MNVPKHVAVIMDGNRRFSRRLMAKPWKGHEWGAEKVEHFLDWCGELGVEEVTLYAFSVQNFERPKIEFDFLMGVFLDSFTRLMARIESGDEKVRAMRVLFIGRLSLFPEHIQEAMRTLMERTKDHVGLRLNVAVGYGGREEVIDAIRALGEQLQRGELSVDAINEKSFARNLYMESEPDLVIRTGGERRTSNFLLWQAHYSEWVFVEKLWPEFEKEDFLAAVESYSSRERRFGK